MHGPTSPNYGQIEQRLQTPEDWIAFVKKNDITDDGQVVERGWITKIVDFFWGRSQRINRAALTMLETVQPSIKKQQAPVQELTGDVSKYNFLVKYLQAYTSNGLSRTNRRQMEVVNDLKEATQQALVAQLVASLRVNSLPKNIRIDQTILSVEEASKRPLPPECEIHLYFQKTAKGALQAVVVNHQSTRSPVEYRETGPDWIGEVADQIDMKVHREIERKRIALSVKLVDDIMAEGRSNVSVSLQPNNQDNMQLKVHVTGQIEQPQGYYQAPDLAHRLRRPAIYDQTLNFHSDQWLDSTVPPLLEHHTQLAIVAVKHSIQQDQQTISSYLAEPSSRQGPQLVFQDESKEIGLDDLSDSKIIVSCPAKLPVIRLHYLLNDATLHTKEIPLPCADSVIAIEQAKDDVIATRNRTYAKAHQDGVEPVFGRIFTQVMGQPNECRLYRQDFVPRTTKDLLTTEKRDPQSQVSEVLLPYSWVQATLDYRDPEFSQKLDAFERECHAFYAAFRERGDQMLGKQTIAGEQVDISWAKAEPGHRLNPVGLEVRMSSGNVVRLYSVADIDNLEKVIIGRRN